MPQVIANAERHRRARPSVRPSVRPVVVVICPVTVRPRPSHRRRLSSVRPSRRPSNYY